MIAFQACRRSAAVLAVLGLGLSTALATAAPAAAHPTVGLAPTSPTDLTFAATDNVDYLGRFPEHTGTAGGQLSPDRRYFYVTDPRGVYVYDVSTPETPRRLGSIALFQTGTGAALAQEDPNSNGRILLVDAASNPAGTAQLQVVDVSDPRSLRVLDTVTVTDHTWTCVTGTDDTGARNSCAYAYGRTGHIVDLTSPAQAELLPTTWRSSVGYGDRSNSPYTHDLTELRPGLVMSAGSTPILMDTSNPAAPVRLAAIDQPGRFPSLGYHSLEWGRGGRDAHVVLGTEISPGPGTGGAGAGSDCEGSSSVLETWDTSSVRAALDRYQSGVPAAEAFAGVTFTKVDTYDAGSRGLFLDGAALGNVLYCAHWMELNPDFKRSGRMAVSYYDRGTRFVDIRSDGTMAEVGWIVPADGYSGSPQWVTNSIVYVMDYRRGLEVIRLNDMPATRVKRNQSDAINMASSFADPGVDVSRLALLLPLFLLLGLARIELRRRRLA